MNHDRSVNDASPVDERHLSKGISWLIDYLTARNERFLSIVVTCSILWSSIVSSSVRFVFISSIVFHRVYRVIVFVCYTWVCLSIHLWNSQVDILLMYCLVCFISVSSVSNRIFSSIYHESQNRIESISINSLWTIMSQRRFLMTMHINYNLTRYYDWQTITKTSM
jgi:hypothetical protein